MKNRCQGQMASYENEKLRNSRKEFDTEEDLSNLG